VDDLLLMCVVESRAHLLKKLETIFDPQPLAVRVVVKRLASTNSMTK
jgi:hypothetical protein